MQQNKLDETMEWSFFNCSNDIAMHKLKCDVIGQSRRFKLGVRGRGFFEVNRKFVGSV